MKMVVIIAALMALVFAAISANARTQPAGASGMASTAIVLPAK
jgi:hypothetical protein